MAGGYIGSSMARVEDARLVSGAGRYVADIALPGCLDAAFARSTVAHGRVRSVDTVPARSVPGVVGAWSASDLPDLPATPPFGPRETVTGREWPALAVDRVRHVGQPLTAVVAAGRYAAEDGLDAVTVDVDPLPAVLDPTQAAGADAVTLFEGSGNIVTDADIGEPVSEETWAGAPVVVEAAYRQQLLAPTSIEARAILVRPEEDGGLTVWCSHQAPHRLRDALAVALELAAEQVRVIVPDVGGAFGAKSETFPEYIVVAYLARRLGRPVRWVEDRAEALSAATHGRGQNQRVRLAADRDGRMLALAMEIDADIGGYPHLGIIPPTATARMATGAYATPQVHTRLRCVVTNTTPTAPYRGAGRPEAAYAIERTVDLLARRLGMDPAEVRRRNFIAPDAFPYETPTGRVYDSGNYPAALSTALDAVDYDGWRTEQARRRAAADGPPLGIGICSYVERSGGSPGMVEYGSVEACADGTFVARSGSSSTGQAHETTFAQVVASVLGVDAGAVQVVEADTAQVPSGIGSFASRSMQVGGSALHRAALRVIEEARLRMARLSGASPDQISYAAGTLTAGGDSASLASLAGRTGPLRADEEFGPPQAFPFGCYVAVVEVDPALGNVEIRRLAAVDDYGVVINPLVVAGQGHGSVAQGLGQALYEQVPYDAEGRPLVGDLLQYLLPTLSEMPEGVSDAHEPTARTRHSSTRRPGGAAGSPRKICQDLSWGADANEARIVFEETETPNPNVPLGAKGAGEAGCIGTPPAIVNAVVDALDLDDPQALHMPLTPQACWAAAHARR